MEIESTAYLVEPDGSWADLSSVDRGFHEPMIDGYAVITDGKLPEFEPASDELVF